MTQQETDKPRPTDRVQFGDEKRASHISSLEHRLDETRRELQRLKGESTGMKSVDRKGRGGTPNLSGNVSEQLSEGRPTDVDFLSMGKDDRVLHNVVSEGPQAFVENGTPVYPVHERAEDVLVHAHSLARDFSGDGSAAFLTTPTVKRFLEVRGGERLKHTQVRRVFEQIEQAGAEYPRPPIIHKNRDGVIELVLFDYDRILGAPL